MPRLFADTVLRACDANDTPSSGARLFVYLAGTTMPVTTFSDAALTTPQAFPVVADSAGVFPPVYVAAGLYKIALRTAADAELPGSPIDNVPAVDADVDGVVSVSGDALVTPTSGTEGRLADLLSDQQSRTTQPPPFNWGLDAFDFGGPWKTAFKMAGRPSGTYSGTRFTATVEHASDSGVNGPSTAGVGLGIWVEQPDWLTTSSAGEVDGVFAQVRKGRVGDAAILLGGYKKVEGGSGAGVAFEFASRIVTDANLTQRLTQVIAGLQSTTVGGIHSGTGGVGFRVDARNGQTFAGFASVLNAADGEAGRPTATLDWHVWGGAANSAAARNFGVAGDGEVWLGGTSAAVRLRSNAGVLEVRDLAGADLARLSTAGALTLFGAQLLAGGAATNVNLRLTPKGTGVVVVEGTIPTYADNAAAVAAGLTVGALYRRTGHGLDSVV